MTASKASPLKPSLLGTDYTNTNNLTRVLYGKCKLWQLSKIWEIMKNNVFLGVFDRFLLRYRVDQEIRCFKVIVDDSVNWNLNLIYLCLVNFLVSSRCFVNKCKDYIWSWIDWTKFELIEKDWFDWLVDWNTFEF